MPPGKDLKKHKMSLSASIDPIIRVWLRETYEKMDCRSESHAVEKALKLLKRQFESDPKSIFGIT